MHTYKVNRWLLSIIVGLATVAVGLGIYLLVAAPVSDLGSPTATINDSPENDQISRVVIISWDGAKPSVIKSLLGKGQLPTFALLQKEGLLTLSAKTVVPSVTLPAHTSMLTGRPIEQHKITWNDYQPAKGYVQVETIFELAKKTGVKTAMVVTKEKFEHLNKPGTVDVYVYSKGSLEAATNEAVKIIGGVEPWLVFLHLKEPDGSGHAHGWGHDAVSEPASPEYINALIEVDRVTGLLVSFLKSFGYWDKTVVIITADHGGIGNTHGSDDLEDTTIPWMAAGGSVMGNWRLVEPVATMDTAATTLSLLGIAVPTDWTGKNALNRID